MPLLSRTYDAARSWVADRLGGTDDGCRCDPHPDCALPLIRLVGSPGGGKTLAAYRLAMASAMFHGLPLCIQDTKGDVSRYVQASLRQATSKDADYRDIEVSEYIKEAVIVLRDPTGDDLARYVSQVSARSKRMKVRRPLGFLLVDEAGVLRRRKDSKGDHTGEAFWDLAGTLRNDGLTAFVTCHREFDVPPLGREATRAVLPFACYTEHEFFGQEYDATRFSSAMSKELSYIASSDREIRTVNMDLSKHVDCARIPRVLHQPCNVTRMEALRV